ncbi:hypothetical protein F5050DRAFT_1358568 [Lentinula boryana]|uniref:HMG box domain-containing protein n=1 Tax=Lentinula boryana TaxID=40481 RepID=A0ABQ8PX90_9AGAR|nr:hypothetical protein F5050DRAFT_1358568 [Lentinula boryana]
MSASHDLPPGHSGSVPLSQEHYPKRPRNAWIIFRAEMHAEFKKKYPNESEPELSKRIAPLWRNNLARQKIFYSKAKDEADKHRMRHPNYKFCPQKPAEGKPKAKRTQRRTRGMKKDAHFVSRSSASSDSSIYHPTAVVNAPSYSQPGVPYAHGRQLSDFNPASNSTTFAATSVSSVAQPPIPYQDRPDRGCYSLHRESGYQRNTGYGSQPIQASPGFIPIDPRLIGNGGSESFGVALFDDKIMNKQPNYNINVTVPYLHDVFGPLPWDLGSSTSSNNRRQIHTYSTYQADPNSTNSSQPMSHCTPAYTNGISQRASLQYDNDPQPTSTRALIPERSDSVAQLGFHLTGQPGCMRPYGQNVNGPKWNIGDIHPNGRAPLGTTTNMPPDVKASGSVIPAAPNLTSNFTFRMAAHSGILNPPQSQFNV